MAIYLDSNVLFPWRTFTELDQVAVSIVSQQIQQFVLVPWIVREEASANYYRSLLAAADALDSAIREVDRKFDDLDPVYVEPVPYPDTQLGIWQARLNAFAGAIEQDPADAAEALRREAWREAPARASGTGAKAHGIGGRDAAVWLAVTRDHNGRSEPGHFISPDGHLAIRDAMAEDIKTPERLTIYSSIDEFLTVLGEARNVDASVIDLRTAVGSVKVALGATLDVPRAVFESLDLDNVRYRAEVVAAQPVCVVAARAYEREGEQGLVVVDSEWEIVANVLHRPRTLADDSTWWIVDDVRLKGTIQLYFPDVNHPDLLPQLISARLQSDTHVYPRDDGSTLTTRRLDARPSSA